MLISSTLFSLAVASIVTATVCFSVIYYFYCDVMRRRQESMNKNCKIEVKLHNKLER